MVKTRIGEPTGVWRMNPRNYTDGDLAPTPGYERVNVVSRGLRAIGVACNRYEFVGVSKLSQCGRVQNVRRRKYTVLDKFLGQMRNMHDLVMVSDDDCKDQLRMDRASFHKLCGLVCTFGGLKSSRNISVEEKVAMFLSILAHHTKNRCVKFRFKRSGLQGMFLVPAESVDENTLDPRWAKFQGCLGALDGTYIDVHVLMDARSTAVGPKVEEDALIHCLTQCFHNRTGPASSTG
ncbi:hypothetical protein ACS0TY_022378 [Phlomoides rotata]